MRNPTLLPFTLIPCMNKHFIRFIAVLLVPCLIADPVATTLCYANPGRVFNTPGLATNQAPLSIRFGEEALELPCLVGTPTRLKRNVPFLSLLLKPFAKVKVLWNI